MARKNSSNNRRGKKAHAASSTAVPAAAAAPVSTPAKSVKPRTQISPEERQTRHFKGRVSSYMRRNEDTFKAVCLVLDLLAASQPEDKREEAVSSMWSAVTRYDKKYFTGVYKKRRNSNNPLRLAGVKRPSTAYAFFTQEMHTSVKKANPDVAFGELSKIIREMWKNLSNDDKKRYKDLAAQDNARYHKAKAHVLGLLDGSVKAKTKADKEVYARLQANLTIQEESSVEATSAAPTATKTK